MIDIKVKNLDFEKTEFQWENGAEMANECMMTILQVLCNADESISNHMPNSNKREELRYLLSEVLMDIVRDFKNDNMSKFRGK
mgnify:CR=1 FL=1